MQLGPYSPSSAVDMDGRAEATGPRRKPSCSQSEGATYCLAEVRVRCHLNRSHPSVPVQTFALERPLKGSTCLSRSTLRPSTRVASLTLGPRLRRGGLPGVSDKSNSRIIGLLVLLMSQTFARKLAATGSKCLRRSTRRCRSGCRPRTRSVHQRPLRRMRAGMACPCSANGSRRSPRARPSPPRWRDWLRS